MVDDTSTFNGAQFSPVAVEETKIVSGVLAVKRVETKGSFVRRNKRFSLFKWFKRSNCDSTTIGKGHRHIFNKINEENSSSSSTESIDTFDSTTTVRSFTFQRNNDLTINFSNLAEKENNQKITNIHNHTLPNTFSRKKDITERYSLQPSIPFNSCGNISVPVNKSCSLLKKKAHVKGKRRAPNPPDFKLKCASNSNAERTTIKTGRRRRPAPKPPEKNNLEIGKSTGMNCEIRDDYRNCSTISNDTLILQEGVLLAKKGNKKSSECREKVHDIKTSGGSISNVEISQYKESQSSSLPAGTLGRAMPRPWYKRDFNTGKRSDVFRNSISIEKKEDSGLSSSSGMPFFPFEGSLSKLNFFHRIERNDKRKEAKRKSGISILTNISELDKEAVAIVQEEQAKARASTLLQNRKFIELEDKVAVNEEIVQDMVASAIETSPKRTTRALISKFNAISNITKVTVNTNFFSKTSPTTERSNKSDNKSRGYQNKSDWLNDIKSRDQNNEEKQSIQYKQDLSRYFLPHPKSPTLKSRFDQVKINSVENKNYPEPIQQKLYENSNTFTDRYIQKEKKNENLSFSNKSSSIKASVIENTNELTRSFDGVERVVIVKDIFLPKQNKRHSGYNETSDNENIKTHLSSHKDHEKPTDNKKVLSAEKNTSPTMINKLDIIFDEIDKQLRYNKIKIRDNNSKTELQTDFSIKSEKTEIETNSNECSTDKIFGNKAISKSNNSELDLKEILKEMKHSLPKRSRVKKIMKDDLETTNVSNKSYTSALRDLNAFNTNLKIDNTQKTDIFVPSREMFELEMRRSEKKKVSSAAQTCGNVRKVENLPSTSTQNIKQDIIFTSIKNDNDDVPKLIKKKFHLIRPKDFAEIEAIKIMQKSCQENTYANVIEQSVYANTVVLPQKRALNTQPSIYLLKENEELRTNNHLLPSRINKEEKLIQPETKLQQDNCDDHQKQNMNTLAVNKLLKKLEAAIASGNHQQASMLAKELAQLKIHCSVIRQRAANTQTVYVNLYIEDKEAHQGPIPLLLPLNMTVADLKTKIYVEFEIPTNIQRWIIGKNLADREDSTLAELQAAEGSPVFLYLVAPDLNPDDLIHPDKANIVEGIEKSNIQKVNLLPEASISTQKPLEIEEKKEIIEDVKLERYEELMSLENCDVIPNSEPIECPICLLTYGPQEGITLRDCLHKFCRLCIANLILHCEEAEVKCPYRDSVYTCESTLQEREIKALVAPEVYQQHLAKSISQAENNAGNDAFHCRTPDCPGWCIYDDKSLHFLCPVCHMNNCLTCQVIHVGKNCRQYQQEVRLSKETDQESKRTAAMLEEMVDRGEALPCPTCAVVLMKKWGCDWLRCSMCKTEICWVTKGPRWGPAGKGDTSGGCKCGENGLKCHPRCNYCH